MNGDFKGTSPVTFAVPSDQALDIRIEKDGYQAADVQNLPTERSGYGIWDVVGGIIPLIVDRSDGAIMGHQQTTMAIHLERQ